MIGCADECPVFSMTPVYESSTEYNSFFSLRGKIFLWGAWNWTQMILMGPFQVEMFSDSIKNCSWLQNSAGQTENGSSLDKWNRLENRSLRSIFEVAGR